ncbi:GCN5-related N-acetyltransferase [Calothrix sp. NIES-4071]|nr:GCN5-related N-acetyltransferase [Calothrix sp. NIES-4071]BAZ58613.1 GCN5-related N-acetyltransferase [Calothrix sp. NIES-4105]
MKLNRFYNAIQFYDHVKDYLISREAQHCLLLGISDTLVHNPERYPPNPYLASVEVAEQVVAVAIMTHPYKLVLSCQDLGAIEIFAKDLYTQSLQVPGVSGQTSEALAFAKTWQNLTGQTYKLGMQMRIHELQAVQPIARANGYLRNATEADRALLLQWNQDFELEVFGEQLTNAQYIDNHIKQNTIYIWQDEIPVSFVCCAGSTPNGKRLGPVYTPKEYRKKGYATTCVAELSQKFLDMGCKSCFLFTDLANPVSNHIYRKIGYLPITDCCEYKIIR